MAKRCTRVWLGIGLLVTASACRKAPLQAPAPQAPTEQPPPAQKPPPAAVKLGAILPLSASADLSDYAGLVREGIELALAQYPAVQGRKIELVVKDDAGDAAEASRAASALEADGAVAIIGPLTGPSLDAAAASRSNSTLMIVSPTAAQQPAGATHVLSLNLADARGAAALAAWAVSNGMTRLAVLGANSADENARARAFVQEATRRGAQLVAQLNFDPGTTTFATPIERLKDAHAQAVFVPAGERDIKQMAPQFAYFGLTETQILGTEAWVSDDVMRSLSAETLEGVVAATPLPSAEGTTGWSDFVHLYEQTQRRTLDNPYPALGYDAAMLVLQQIAAGATEPASVAERLASIRDYRGATGVLSITDGQVSRRPFLVRVRGGKLASITFAGDS